MKVVDDWKRVKSAVFHYSGEGQQRQTGGGHEKKGNLSENGAASSATKSPLMTVSPPVNFSLMFHHHSDVVSTPNFTCEWWKWLNSNIRQRWCYRFCFSNVTRQHTSNQKRFPLNGHFQQLSTWRGKSTTVWSAIVCAFSPIAFLSLHPLLHQPSSFFFPTYLPHGL